MILNGVMHLKRSRDFSFRLAICQLAAPQSRSTVKAGQTERGQMDGWLIESENVMYGNGRTEPRSMIESENVVREREGGT